MKSIKNTFKEIVKDFKSLMFSYIGLCLVISYFEIVPWLITVALIFTICLTIESLIKIK